MNPKKSEAGFTMLELLIVIVIIGITAAMTVPRFKELNNGLKMDAARRLILSTANAASRTSKARNRDVYMVFDFTNDRITLYVDEDEDGDYTDEQPSLVRALPQGIDLAGLTGSTTDGEYIKFNSYGTLTVTTGASIHFAPEGTPYAAGSEDAFQTVVIANTTQKPRYYPTGVNNPFPAPPSFTQ